tara:strand:- start:1715 stop:1957 length:243 start_codon:yes stop_codon:yes gene_type:complete
MKDAKTEKMKKEKMLSKKSAPSKKGMMGMMGEKETPMPGAKPYKKGGLMDGGKVKKKYAKGGKVRGAGCATKGTRTAKIY